MSKRHTASFCSICGLPSPLCAFLKGALQFGVCLLMLVPGAVLSVVHDFAFLLFLCYEMPVRPFLQPVQFPCNDSMTLWDISHSYQFCFTDMLLPVLSVPSSTSLMTINRTGIDPSGIPLFTGLQLGHLSPAGPCH